ncbi:unnamed protein product [Closterium sp. NIES-53]
MPPKGSRTKAVVDAPAGGGDPASKSTPGKGTEVVDNLPAEAEVTAGVSGLTIEEKLHVLAATVVSDDTFLEDDSDEELEIDTTKSTHPHLCFTAILLFPVIPSREELTPMWVAKACYSRLQVSFLHESDAVKIKQTAVEHKRQNGLTLHCFWLHQEDAAYLRTKALGPQLLEVYFKDVPADIPPELVKEVMVTHPLRMRKQSAFAEGHCFHRVLHPITGADTDRIKGLVVQHAGDKHRWCHEFRHQLLGGTALLAYYPLLSCPLCGGHHYDKFHNSLMRHFSLAAASLRTSLLITPLLLDAAFVLISTGSNREEWVCTLESCGKTHGKSFMAAADHITSASHLLGLEKLGAATRSSLEKLSLHVIRKEYQI